MGLDDCEKGQRKAPFCLVSSTGLRLPSVCAVLCGMLLFLEVSRMAWRGDAKVAVGDDKASTPNKRNDSWPSSLQERGRRKPLVLTSHCHLDTPSHQTFHATASQLSAMATWAFWHGYDFQPLPFDLDSWAPKGMSKWSAMYKALGAGRPWVLWIDGDAVVPELSHSVERDILSLNLDDNGTLAEECDIVADGFLEKLLDEADFHDGWNTGVVLVRDTAWSRKLIEFILRLTYEDYEGNLKEAAAACTHANCNTTAEHLSDQLIIGNLLHGMDRKQVEEHVCILQWYLQIWWLTRLNLTEELHGWGALSVHYSGTQFCMNFTDSKLVEMQEHGLHNLRNASTSILSAHAAHLACDV